VDTGSRQGNARKQNSQGHLEKHRFRAACKSASRISWDTALGGCAMGHLGCFDLSRRHECLDAKNDPRAAIAALVAWECFWPKPGVAA
jgi:hypothetical protein